LLLTVRCHMVWSGNQPTTEMIMVYLTVGKRLRDAAGHEYEVLDVDYVQQRVFMRRNGDESVERWLMKSTVEKMFDEGKLEVLK